MNALSKVAPGRTLAICIATALLAAVVPVRRARAEDAGGQAADSASATADTSGGSAVRAADPRRVETQAAATDKTSTVKGKTAARKTQTLETVQVVGLRQSAESAVSRQRFAPQIMESVVAQSIGKLPDTNAADALSRLPGIQITEDEGEGSTVTIRGLTEIQTLLNGNTIFTASGSRGLNFEDVPAGILAGIDVYKDPTANQIEGGVGGIIDIRTHKPFDFNGFESTVSVGATNANQAAATKPKFSGLISNIWHTGIGKFGALVAVSYEQRPVNQISFTSNSVDYYTGPVGNGSTLTPDDPLLYNAGGEVENTRPGTRTREGLNTSFEWQPNDRWLFQLNTYSAYFKTAQHGYEVRFDDSLPGVFSDLVPDLVHGQSTLVDYTKWPGTNFLKTGTFDNVFSNAAEDYTNEHDRLNQVALSGKWRATDKLTLSSEISTTRSVHTEREGKLELFGFVPQMDVDMATTQPSFVPVGFSLASRSSWFWNDIEDDRFHNNASERAFRFDGKYATGDPLFPTVEFGYRYDNRQSGNFENEIFEGPNASNYENGGAIVPGTLFGYNVADLDSGPTSAAAASVLTPRFTRFGRVLLPRDDIFTDINSFYKLMGIGGPVAPLDQYVPADTFGASERTDGVYALGFMSTGGAIPVDANFGVRYVRTRDVLNGMVRPLDTPLTDHNTYESLLPSINLTAHLTDDLQLRFGANKTISRPSFTDLSPTVELDGASHTGKGGNPELQPFKATGYDMALEWYPAKGADLFGDVFYKHIRNAITNVSSISFEPNGVDSGLYLIDRPENNKEGMFRGIETGYQQFFTRAPWLFRYTGINLSYTYVHSSVTGAVPGFVTPLPDLSRDSYNVILMFDLPHRFWARLAYNWRSGFFEGFETGSIGPSAQSLPQFMHPFGIVDASAGYWITRKLELSMDAVNLAHSVERSYEFNPLLPYQILMEDRRVTLNLSYTF